MKKRREIVMKKTFDAGICHSRLFHSVVRDYKPEVKEEPKEEPKSMKSTT